LEWGISSAEGRNSLKNSLLPENGTQVIPQVFAANRFVNCLRGEFKIAENGERAFERSWIKAIGSERKLLVRVDLEEDSAWARLRKLPLKTTAEERLESVGRQIGIFTLLQRYMSKE
jgi:hypothetical protein